jgi:serine/threonine-protein kinase
MGAVWAARLHGGRGSTRTVAVKVMRPELAIDPRFVRMFLAEAKVGARVRHPNVCPVLDLGEDRNVLYLVMDLVEGESLAAVLRIARARGQRIPHATAAWIAARAARGLAAAHALRDERGQPSPVVHQDVSPENILATREGLVQVTDFGVAKSPWGERDATASGLLHGKVAYLAPEQVRGAPVDPRTDIFALGSVLFELSTGQHPFRDATDLSTILRIGSGEPSPLPSGVPGGLRTILTKALDKDVDRRYQAMSELAADLEEYAAAAGPTDAAAVRFLANILGDRRRIANGQRDEDLNASFVASPPAAAGWDEMRLEGRRATGEAPSRSRKCFGSPWPGAIRERSAARARSGRRPTSREA